MNDVLMDQMSQMFDAFFPEPDLNAYLKSFVREKSQEGSRWAEITRCAYYMFGGQSQAIEKNAALTELMLLAIDIIDDIQDRDNYTKPWMNCPMEHALNAVCSLLVAFIAEAPPQSAPIAGQLLALSVNGQQQDLNGSVQSEPDYMNMIHKKSGALLRFACHMGTSLLPEQPLEVREAMNDLAECIGVIAQLENDLRDVQKLELKSDMLSRKKTLPILFLLRDEDSGCPYVRDYYAGRLGQDQLLAQTAEILDYVEQSGCLEYTRVIQALYIERADMLLESLPVPEKWKQQFRSTTFAVQAPLQEQSL